MTTVDPAFAVAIVLLVLAALAISALFWLARGQPRAKLSPERDGPLCPPIPLRPQTRVVDRRVSALTTPRDSVFPDEPPEDR